MLRSFALAPYVVSRKLLEQLRTLQPITNQLYNAIAEDPEFVQAALGRAGTDCAWGAKELEIYLRTFRSQASKPRLLLPNSVFLETRPDEVQAGSTWALTVGNVQAGEPHQLQQVHNLQIADHPCIESGPLRVHCAALARVARMVHPAKPIVAILTKPRENLALRSLIDVRGVGHVLLKEHGVRPIYVSMRDFVESRIDESGDLRLASGDAVSVVYSRYDFSHPRGFFARSMEDDIPKELVAEWEAIEKMERSSAVVSSWLGNRLAHRRSIQWALTQPGMLERFLSAGEAAAVRAVIPEQWHLGTPEGLDAACTLLSESTPDKDGMCGFVAKNLLRPRTGSGNTQDRKASGGGIVHDHRELSNLIADKVRRQCYILYRRETSRPHDAQIVMQDSGKVQSLTQSAVSELAAYGAFIADASGLVVENIHAGFGVRTRPASPLHPLAAALGYGALNCAEADISK